MDTNYIIPLVLSTRPRRLSPVLGRRVALRIHARSQRFGGRCPGCAKEGRDQAAGLPERLQAEVREESALARRTAGDFQLLRETELNRFSPQVGIVNRRYRVRHRR
jgi:hypothetical protein